MYRGKTPVGLRVLPSRLSTVPATLYNTPSPDQQSGIAAAAAVAAVGPMLSGISLDGEEEEEAGVIPPLLAGAAQLDEDSDDDGGPVTGVVGGAIIDTESPLL